MAESEFEILRAQVDAASEEYTKAKQHFWRVSADVPTGTPNPDGQQRMESAARAQTAAMVRYTNALRRFNEFLLNSTVPRELEKR